MDTDKVKNGKNQIHVHQRSWWKYYFILKRFFFKPKSEWTYFDEGIHFIIHPQRIINAVEWNEKHTTLSEQYHTKIQSEQYHAKIQRIIVEIDNLGNNTIFTYIVRVGGCVVHEKICICVLHILECVFVQIRCIPCVLSLSPHNNNTNKWKIRNIFTVNHHRLFERILKMTNVSIIL